MSKFLIRYPVNLQMFAGEAGTDDVDLDDDGAAGVEFEIDDSDDSDDQDDGVDLDDDDDAGADDQDEDQQDDNSDDSSQQQKDNRTVPLSELLKERQKYKDRLNELNRKASLADKVMQQAGVADIEAFQQQLDQLEAQRMVQQGVPPQQAQFLVQQQRELTAMKQQLNKQKYDVEAATLKANPFFADIDDVRDELEEVAARTGLTLEQAYMATRGTQRMKDFETQVTQRVLNNQQKKQSKKLDTSNSGQPKTQPKVKLSANELAVAKAAHMTPEEYYKYKKK